MNRETTSTNPNPQSIILLFSSQEFTIRISYFRVLSFLFFLSFVPSDRFFREREYKKKISSVRQSSVVENGGTGGAGGTRAWKVGGGGRDQPILQSLKFDTFSTGVCLSAL